LGTLSGFGIEVWQKDTSEETTKQSNARRRTDIEPPVNYRFYNSNIETVDAIRAFALKIPGHRSMSIMAMLRQQQASLHESS